MKDEYTTLRNEIEDIAESYHCAAHLIGLVIVVLVDVAIAEAPRTLGPELAEQTICDIMDSTLGERKG